MWTLPNKCNSAVFGSVGSDPKFTHTDDTDDAPIRGRSVVGSECGEAMSKLLGVVDKNSRERIEVRAWVSMAKGNTL